MRFLRHAAIVAWKDLRVEMRTREVVYTTLFFAVMAVLIFSFAFVEGDGTLVGDVSAGVLWVTIAFSGLLALTRAFEREREGGTLRALLMSPAERGAIFLGKSIGILLYMVTVEVVIVPLIGVLFNANVLAAPLHLFALIVLGTIGFAVVGSLFAAMLLQSRMRGVLLPVVLYPVLMPALIAGAKGTVAVLGTPADVPVANFWIGLLVGYDILFLLASLWAFETLVIE